MKAFLLLITAAILAAGCREINVSTKINSDGSVVRSIKIYSDDADARNHLFPYVIDSSWTESKQENAKENKDLFTYTKQYNGFEDYNTEFKNAGNSSSFIQKKFRFFYTYYRFQENYKSYNEFNLIPAEEFFSGHDLARIEKGVDTSWINKQTERWQQRNLMEEIFQAVVKGAQREKFTSITAEAVSSRKEEFFRKVTTLEKGDIDIMIPILNEMFNTNEASLLRNDLREVNSRIEKKIELMGRAEGDYENEVTLPGIIVNTNAGALVGNKAIWNFNADKYLIRDFEMYAESRELNTSFLLGSGIAVLLLIGGLSIPFFRKRK